MKKNIFICCVLIALLAALFSGCARDVNIETAELPAAQTETPEAETAQDASPRIDLNAGTAVPAQAVWADPAQLSIIAAGSYELSGSLEGKILVDADGPVTLILDGVTLVGESCLDIRSNDTVTLVAAAGTENVFTDALPASASGEASSAEPASAEPDADAAEPDGTDIDTEAETEAEEPDATGAVITSKAPLVLAGGSVAVSANVNNGIRAKDGLTVQSGTLTVTAANHGVRAKSGITVLDGQVSVTAGGDALRAEAGRVTPGAVSIAGGAVVLSAAGRGIDAEDLVSVSDGTVSITAEDDGIRADTVDITGGWLTLDTGCDGIQAVSLLSVSGGQLDLTTGGGGGSAINHAGDAFGPMMWSSSTATELENSAKGLKSDGDIAISGGVIGLSTADDSIHCSAVCTVDGGEITILSSDDGIHADDMLVINDGVIAIDDCFEGLEAFAVEIHGGDVVIRAVNDGINANGQEMMFRRSSDIQETEITSASGAATTYVLISGGSLNLVVTGNSNNMGDGIDSNGAVYITGGEVIVSTFGTFMENGIDTGWGGPVVTGGKVIAGGSSTMAEGFSSSSTQCCAVIATNSTSANTEVVLSDEDGNVLWSVTLADTFSCLQISHPDMQVGHVYTLSYGSQSTTLDFTSTNLIESTRGFGFGGRPF